MKKEMKIVKCKDCLAEIDAKAKKCSKCGTDQRSWLNRNPIAGCFSIVVIAFILLMIVSPASKVEESSTGVPGKTAQETVVSAEPTVIDLDMFVGEFDKNQLAAEEKYEGVLVELTGYIDNISEDIMGTYFVILEPSRDDYYFGTSVQCYFKDRSALTSLENGQKVTLLGTVDSQLMNVQIKNCSVKESL